MEFCGHQINAGGRTGLNAVRCVRDFNVIDEVKENKIKEAEKMLPEVYGAIDKTVKIKYLKKNTGARYKSRITLFLNKSKAKK